MADKSITIEVKGVQTRPKEFTYPLPVWQVTVQSEKEIFGEEPLATEGEVRAYLKGLSHGLHVGGIVGVHIPGVPPPNWFTEQKSHVEKGGTLDVLRANDGDTD